MWFLVSLYVQQVLGYSALEAGLTFLPMSLAIAAATHAASRLAARLGPGRVLAVGMTLLGAGMLLFSRIDARGSWTADVLVPSLLCATGIGCSFVSTTIAATTGVARGDSGLASGLVNTSFQIGGSIGLALLATIAAGASEPGTLTEGFPRAFAAGGVLALAGAGVALAVLAGRVKAASVTVNAVVNDPFKALSHPIRRGIVERLAAGPATVGDATSGFGVSKPAISKHLKVLEETGVVTRVVVGRTHRLSLEPDVLSEAADWMDRQRALWGRLFDVVDEYLKEKEPR